MEIHIKIPELLYYFIIDFVFIGLVAKLTSIKLENSVISKIFISKVLLVVIITNRHYTVVHQYRKNSRLPLSSFTVIIRLEISSIWRWAVTLEKVNREFLLPYSLRNGSMAVSYTHLDVYKRQALNCRVLKTYSCLLYTSRCV